LTSSLLTTYNKFVEKVTEDTALTKTTPLPRADIAIPTNDIYRSIAQTIEALRTITVDGVGEISTLLQAHNTKKFLPDTEIEMLHSNALPATKVQVEEFKQISLQRNSLQHRIGQLKLSTHTLAETTGARLRIAYRLARYMTHIRGIGGIGQPLIFSFASSNAQVNLLEMPLPYNPTTGWYRGMAAIRALLAEITQNGQKYTYLIENDVFEATGMSILPPPLHDGYFPENLPAWQARRQNYTPEDYNPLMDGPLATYLNICELLVRHLTIGEVDLHEQAAATALLNPRIARLAWPCRDDIETFEEYVLLPYIIEVLVKNTPIKAVEFLKKEMRLTHAEAFDFVETAKTYSQQAFVFTPERERSVMINKLHRLADECNEAGMVTTELNTHKTILQILGLTRHEEDTNVDKRETLSSALEAQIVEKKAEFLPSTDEEQ
jgi:hypothetical protein